MGKCALKRKNNFQKILPKRVLMVPKESVYYLTNNINQPNAFLLKKKLHFFAFFICRVQ